MTAVGAGSGGWDLLLVVLALLRAAAFLLGLVGVVALGTVGFVAAAVSRFG